MKDKSTKTKNNSKLIWGISALIVAVAALNIWGEISPIKKPVSKNDPEAYLKNNALKTALERSRN
ncbi:MAG: hypothetical protein IKV03_03000 [Alphaproteobacteria bacterium]|nr:hypothetical protein [Alphaproteobacteria bacterium]